MVFLVSHTGELRPPVVDATMAALPVAGGRQALYLLGSYQAGDHATGGMVIPVPAASPSDVEVSTGAHVAGFVEALAGVFPDSKVIKKSTDTDIDAAAADAEVDVCAAVPASPRIARHDAHQHRHSHTVRTAKRRARARGCGGRCRSAL
jgi:hypothetical protein